MREIVSPGLPKTLVVMILLFYFAFKTCFESFTTFEDSLDYTYIPDSGLLEKIKYTAGPAREKDTLRQNLEESRCRLPTFLSSIGVG